MITYEFKTYYLCPIVDGTYMKVRTSRDFERYTDTVPKDHSSQYVSRLCEKYSFGFKGHGRGKPVSCVINRVRFDYDFETKVYHETNYNDVRIEDRKDTAEQYRIIMQEVSHLNGSGGINEYTTLFGILTYSNGSNNPSRVIKHYTDVIKA
ncbi:MAG: hypothetical protein GY941_21795 [Planctomycetes bacterium]|nr:hypothetical protein [Planctomycetota bacterium]